MANTDVIAQQTPVKWIHKYSRKVIFTLLDKLYYGQLELVENHHHHYFPQCPEHNAIRGTVVIHDLSAYYDIVKGGSIGAAEAFIAGKWSSPNLTNVIRIFAKAQQHTDKLEANKSWFNQLKNAFAHWKNKNTTTGSKRNILAHYDLGNELYLRFLDKNLMYSAAIYPTNTATLAEAQQYKLQAICEKLGLTEHDHLLEIGTGWGGLAIYAAQNYGCHVTTTTISDAQHQYAYDRIKALGLTNKINLLKKDYRELTGTYDKVVSIEMIEAVGFQFLPSFFKQCNSRLKSGGKLLLQSITIADQRFSHYKNNVDFIQRYIFPGGFLPSITELNKHLTKHTDLVTEHIEDIGLDYARTLADWRSNFLAAWPDLVQLGYDEQFKRLWLYYLGYCEGAFLERSTSTIQLVARK